MSPVTTTQGLKAGNAVEEDMIKLLKDGLNTIADGMLQECRKRNAALGDLEEDLEKNAALPKPSNPLLGPDKLRRSLESVLVIALEDCHKAADEAYERYETAYDEGSASFDQQTKEWITAVERNENFQKKLSNELCKTLGQVYGQVDDVLRDKVWKAYEDMSKDLGDEARRLIQVKNRIEEFNEQNKKKLDGYFEVYQRRNGIARERAETYKLIAERAGLNLRA